MSVPTSIPREFLAARENWQAEANKRGAESEVKFHEVMASALQCLPGLGDYNVVAQPDDLRRIFGGGRWGVRPDAAVINKETGRTVFVEVKRQNPRGNAHERACKYFAPGLVAAARKKGNIHQDDFPFFLVFTNGLATSEKYAEEISFWFSAPEVENHFLLWNGDAGKLLDFFLHKIRPVIDRATSQGAA